MQSVQTGLTEIVACLPEAAGGLAVDIRKRGNVPLSVGSSMIMELTPEEIQINWATAKGIKRQVAGAMAAELSKRLCQSLSDLDDNLADHAGEAAACLFLALRHEDIPLQHALAGCRVFWDGHRFTERVECPG